MEENRSLYERLAFVVNQFADKYLTLAQSGALVQLWVPRSLPDGTAVLTTQGNPYSIMGVNYQLAMYRCVSGSYQALCDGSNPRCAVGRVYANLPPELADTESAVSSPEGVFDRIAEARRCGIHSHLVLALHNIQSEAPSVAAVFELAQHEVGVEFTTAVHLLDEVSREHGFWIPELASPEPVNTLEDTVDFLHISGRGSTGSSSSRGGSSNSTVVLPTFGRSKGIRRASCVIAEPPAGLLGRMPASQHQQQGDLCGPAARRQNYQSVIFTEHYKFHGAPKPPTIPRSTAAGEDAALAAAVPDGLLVGRCAAAAACHGLSGASTPPRSTASSTINNKSFLSDEEQLYNSWEAVDSNSRNSIARPSNSRDQQQLLLQARQTVSQRHQQRRVSGDSSSSSGRGSCGGALDGPRTSSWQLPSRQSLDAGKGIRAQSVQSPLGPSGGQSPPRHFQFDRKLSGLHQQQHPQHMLWQQHQSMDLQQQQSWMSDWSDLKQVLHSQGPSRAMSITQSGAISSVGMSSAQSLPSSLPRMLGDSLSGKRVRALITVGGSWKHSGLAGMWEYNGGAQKVVGILRTISLNELQTLLLGKGGEQAASASQNKIKYALPGTAGSYIDVDCEDDIANMWDEWDDFCAHGGNTAARLQLYVGLAATTGSSCHSSLGSDNSWKLRGASTNSSQLQPGTPTTDASGDAAVAAAAAKLSLQQLAASNTAAASQANVQSAMGAHSSADSEAPAVMVPFFDRATSGQEFWSPVGEQTEHQQQQRAQSWSEVQVGPADDVPNADDDDAFATCLDVTGALIGEDTSIAAALAAVAMERQAATIVAAAGSPPGAAAGSIDNNSVKDNVAKSSNAADAFAPAAGSAGTTGSRQVPGSVSGQRKNPELKQLMKQLESKVEVIMPWELNVVRFIGGGAFGEVYLARWHGTEVAVKALSPSLLAGNRSNKSGGSMSSDAAAELLREASVLAGLHHPNIVAVFGVVLPPKNMVSMTLQVDKDDDDLASSESPNGVGSMRTGKEVSGPAVVTEYLSAGSLHSAIQANADWLKGSMAKVKLLMDAARGLDYLHSKHMVHFDMKSANVLVTIRDRVPCAKVADFGLAKRRQQTYVTGVDSLRGTLPWIAPEIVKNPNNVTEKADIYSFGVIMWEVWTGQEPFEGVHLHALLHQLTSPKGLSLAVPGSTEWGEDECSPEPAPGYSALMQQCWCYQRDARPTSRQLVAALEKMQAALRKRKGSKAAA